MILHRFRGSARLGSARNRRFSDAAMEGKADSDRILVTV
jgi:hypothetical protein